MAGHITFRLDGGGNGSWFDNAGQCLFDRVIDPQTAEGMKTSAMASWMRRSGSFSILSPAFTKPTGTVTTSSPR
ncbi:hypothetical protein ASD01_07825 [Ensifer sp. Root423]|nr:MULTISPECIES: hypothetical protein [unclassified Ensifer]KQX16435.1 hypothetical protein ASD01_07825 [Ensifer sp. Root423]KQZ54354.1 hypothetical protein ASD63_26785 [Ensifer sp. Root558]